jgi:hypothetical protein
MASSPSASPSSESLPMVYAQPASLPRSELASLSSPGSDAARGLTKTRGRAAPPPRDEESSARASMACEGRAMTGGVVLSEAATRLCGCINSSIDLTPDSSARANEIYTRAALWKT